MLPRRIIALFALAAAFYLWHAGKTHFSESFLGVLALMLSPIIGILALAALIFNLRAFGPRRPPQDYGLLSERQGNAIGSIVLAFLGGIAIFIGAKGIYTNRVPALGSGADLIFAERPTDYLIAVVGWGAGGCALLYLAWLILPRAKSKRTPL